MYCFEDNYYEHIKDLVKDIFYIEENIPGPTRDEDPESVMICDRHNSQVIRHCECPGECTFVNKCPCITTYGGDNYTNQYNADEKVRLNESKVIGPVFECNSVCSCTNRSCGNRLVQYGPITHLEIKIADSTGAGTTNKGLGLFTNVFIPKGSFICEYAGEVITKAEAIKRHRIDKAENKMNYIFCLNEHSEGNVAQTFVDPSKFGNIGRYVNHSCEPNCRIVPVRVDSVLPKLAIFSVVDIAPGTELTFDYGSCAADAGSGGERKKCLCGSVYCKQWLPCEEYC